MYNKERFTYFDYTLNNVAMSDPQTAPEYYGFMEGFERQYFIMVVLGYPAPLMQEQISWFPKDERSI